jgi:hypothetical protein
VRSGQAQQAIVYSELCQDALSASTRSISVRTNPNLCKEEATERHAARKDHGASGLNAP